MSQAALPLLLVRTLSIATDNVVPRKDHGRIPYITHGEKLAMLSERYNRPIIVPALFVLQRTARGESGLTQQRLIDPYMSILNAIFSCLVEAGYSVSNPLTLSRPTRRTPLPGIRPYLRAGHRKTVALHARIGSAGVTP